jgi:fatty acid/phospholipid biosynthesis enzyme
VSKSFFNTKAASLFFKLPKNVSFNILPIGNTDVVVTDGYTGNMVLKNIEGTAKSIGKMLKETPKNVSFNILPIDFAVPSIFLSTMLPVYPSVTTTCTEPAKGNTLTKKSYQLLKDDQSFNFDGNIEAKTF